MKACTTSFALFNLRLLAFSFFVASLALSSRPAKVDFSTELRLQTTLFGDYGLYEQNRASTDGSEFEHEFRADFSAKKDDLYLLQLRAGRRLLDQTRRRPRIRIAHAEARLDIHRNRRGSRH